MKRFRESALRHTIDRVEAGHITGAMALGEIFATGGWVGFGTAVTSEGRQPTIVLTTSDASGRLGGWRPLVETTDGGTMPLNIGSLGTDAVLPTLWGALGVLHVPFQRRYAGLALLPDDLLYDKGNFGWIFNRASRAYVPRAHTHLLQAIGLLPPATHIGDVDFAANDGSYGVPVPLEPGRFGSMNLQLSVATMPVRAGDLQQLVPQVLTAAHAYEPIRL